MVETTVETKKELFTIEPWDEHNQKTVANVHPNDWVNPEPEGRYNLVVVGAGTAGLVSAIGSAGLGGEGGPHRERADGRRLPRLIGACFCANLFRLDRELFSAT